jgi:hypothetical protein
MKFSRFLFFALVTATLFISILSNNLTAQITNNEKNFSRVQSPITTSNILILTVLDFRTYSRDFPGDSR